MTEPPLRFACGSCGHGLARTSGAAICQVRCPRCGETTTSPDSVSPDSVSPDSVRPAERPDPRPADVPRSVVASRPPARPVVGPTDLTLGSLVRAAGRDCRHAFGLLSTRVLHAELAVLGWALASLPLACPWAIFCEFAFSWSMSLSMDTGPGDEEAILCSFAAASSVGLAPLAFALSHGLAGLSAGIVRGAGPAAPKNRKLLPPGAGRAALCLTPAAVCVVSALATAWLIGGSLLDPLSAPGRWIVGLGVGTLLAAGPFLLLWPVPFLIHDHPESTGFRPIAAAWRLARDQGGGFLAAGLAAYAFLAATIWFTVGGPVATARPEALFPALFSAAICTGICLPLTAPPAFLLLAHAYDRAVRAGIEGD